MVIFLFLFPLWRPDYRYSSHSTTYNGSLAAVCCGERLSFCICGLKVLGGFLHCCFGKEIYRGIW